MDRCRQARARDAGEPEWEARFEPRSCGFRAGRGCRDAIEATVSALCRKDAKRVWILGADLAAAFDRIDHSRLLDALGDFPARKMVADWRKAGVFEPGKGFTPTEEGTPRGGVISPVLLSVAPRGLEEAAGVRYHTGRRAGESVAGSPVLIRYADGMIAFRHSRGQAGQVKARLAEWLKPRGLGLVFNEGKTRVGHLAQGFGFLGFHIRRYPTGELLIKPSPPAVRRITRRLATEMRSLRGSNVRAVLARLIPVVRGWAAYYRGVVSSGVFADLDRHVWTSASGRAGPTPPSRSAGSSPGASASSASSGMTTGCSATVTAASAYPSSPGLPPSGIPWSGARRLRTTRPWPATGPNGADGSHPRSRATRCVCSPGRTGVVRCAGTTCSPPSSHPDLPSNGRDGGCMSPDEQSTATTPCITGGPAHRTVIEPASHTLPGRTCNRAGMYVKPGSGRSGGVLNGGLRGCWRMFRVRRGRWCDLGWGLGPLVGGAL